MLIKMGFQDVCAKDHCHYCANVKLKNTEKQENSVGRIVLVEKNFKDVQREQMEDPCISLSLSRKETGKERPLWQEMLTKVY